MSKQMENDVYNAAVNGDLTIFSIKNQERLLKKTSQNNNIIHIAAKHQKIQFIKAALNNFPATPTSESLICDQNLHGNTPLHIAAEVGNEAIIDQLYDFFSTQCGIDRVFPWRVMNEDGNTPAHVALLRGNISLAMYLVGNDDYVARVTNHSKETLLHLAIQYHIFGENEEKVESQITEIQATSSSKKVYQPTENLWTIVELLLKIDSSVTCWADVDGSTPLHRAASLEPAYRLRVIKAMLASCSEAAEVQDKGTGNTILHLLTNHQVASYEQGQELMGIPHVYALKDSTNYQRDTPMHLAARNRDTIMVRVLKGSSPKLGLKNKSGVSANFLVRELEDQMRITERPRKLTKEERIAAEKGNVAFLEEQLASMGINFLMSQTPMGGNILHILMKYQTFIHSDTEDFFRRAVEILPSLISEQDRNGNTPLHILVKKYSFYSRVVDIMSEYYAKVGETAGYDARGKLQLPPWEMKNAQGDTPLHVAVKAGNYKYTAKLLDLDMNLGGYVNNRNQTPLHLFSSLYNRFASHKDVDKLISCLIDGNPELPYMQDVDGLTPVLAATQERKFRIINQLFRACPDSLKIADYKGRTLWHLLASPLQLNSEPSTDEDKDMMNDTFQMILQHQIYDGDSIRIRIVSKDNDGNTPLHLAIANRQFVFAQYFLLSCREEYELSTVTDCDRYLSTENNKGVSSYNLIGSAEHLPHEFEKFLSLMAYRSMNGNLLYGYRSLYGVPTTKIEEYANTIGVVAALLATITFTAAFTVPGGLDSSNGTPLLLRNAMFQVFVIADVVAMCSSVIVLFCLLWIMTTSNKKESILLLDVSVLLLQTSFYATIVTFMAGLYVTTISIVPAIAISTCVICTLLIVLMHKRLVMLTVVPFGMLFITSIPNFIRFVGENISFQLYWIRIPGLVEFASYQFSNLWSWICKRKRLHSSQNTKADEMPSEASVPS